jgi:hypothetical protein
VTISVKNELSPDLVRNANWPLFSGRPDIKDRYPPLAAYTLTWKNTDKDAGAFLADARKDLELRFVRAVESLGYTSQIFVAHSTMQPRTAMVFYRKIWKQLSFEVVPDSVERGIEHLIECVSGVRFASLANVPMVAIPWTISIVQKFDVVVPLLLRTPLNIQDSSALELAHIAFPPDGCSASYRFDWAAFSCYAATLGGVCIREVRGTAPGDFAVDFFASEADMAALVRSLEIDNGLNMYRVQ